MKAKFLLPTGARGAIRLLVLCVGCGLANGSLPAADEPASAPEKNATAAAEKDAAAELEEAEEVDVSELVNWVDLSAGGVFLHGDKAQFMKRHRLPRGAFGGIEGFHWEKAVGEDGLFKVDGRALFDLHDYKLKLDYTQTEKGFIRAGYTEFRTWYDGSGGYLTTPQPGGTWFSLFDENLYVDRGEAWFEAGLTLPDLPVVQFRYAHQFRDGQKDATLWGDHDTTGAINQSGLRGVVPAFRDLDETRDIFELSATHTIQATDLGLGLRYETSSLDNALLLRRRPGEANADRFVTSREGNELDLFNVHAYSLTRLSEKTVFTAGAAFTTVDSDLSGERFYGSGYDMGYDISALGNRQFGDQGYTNLTGGSKLWEYVLNLNLMYNPWEYFSIVPSVRVQKQDQEGSSSYLDTLDAPGGPLPAVAAVANSDRGLLAVSERIDLRYSAMTNWLFYGRAEWAQDQGDIDESFTGRVLGGFFDRQTDYRRYSQKYSVGAHWYPLRRLNFAAQYYHKIRTSDYDNTRMPATLLLYPGFINRHEFDTDDVNFRLTWRPWNNLTLVSRYDFQLSTIDMRGEGLSRIQSSEITSHLFGQNITWMPLSRLYLQAGGNVVFDRSDTPANDLTGAEANLVLPSENDYWNVNVMAGITLSKQADLQANYYYYRADNFVDNSAVSVPYGADSEEHVVSTTLTYRLNPRTRVNLKYGYFNNREDLTGGHNNYEAHLLYSSLQYLF